MKLDLLTPGIEVGVVTTNLDAMVAFYEGFLGLELQGVVEFDGGSQRRYTLGSGVLKLVTYTAAATDAGRAGWRTRAGRRPVLHRRREEPARAGRRDRSV